VKVVTLLLLVVPVLLLDAASMQDVSHLENRLSASASPALKATERSAMTSTNVSWTALTPVMATLPAPTLLAPIIATAKRALTAMVLTARFLTPVMKTTAAPTPNVSPSQQPNLSVNVLTASGATDIHATTKTNV